MKLTKTKLKQTIEEELNKLQKEGFMDWFKKTPEGPKAAAGDESGKKGNIVVKWESGTKTHHRWALRPSKKEKTDEINKV